ncbi:MAG: pirin family protein [Pseudomonadota bacterium]
MSNTLYPEELQEGASAQVRRLMPTSRQGVIDPFVFFDHFRAAPEAGFSTHPHRGFEAITYLMSGELSHSDNMGNDAVLRAGEVQAFTAGSGMLHSELAGANAAVEGLQLWVNLAQAQKGIAPTYQPPLKPRKIVAAGYELQLIAGNGAPITLQTPCWIAWLDLAAGESFTPEVSADWRGFAYVLHGEMLSDDHARAIAGEGLDLVGGQTLHSPTSARALIALGQPHGEPIIMRGPYVD